MKKWKAFIVKFKTYLNKISSAIIYFLKFENVELKSYDAI